jgi:hypothetical protein
MADHWGHETDGYSFRFFSPGQLDQILHDGFKHGRAGSHAAIERILKHEPRIERAKLWQRIRQLKFPSSRKRSTTSIWTSDDDQILSRGYKEGWSGKRRAVRELLQRHPDWRPHAIWKRAAKLHLIRKTFGHRQGHSHSAWSEHDNQTLLNLAGYKTARTIARMLHRSEAAIRCHLALLGKSSRVHMEGFSRQSLATDLHLGKRTIQRLIVKGLLEVRDPRVTRESLDRLRESGRLGAQPDQNARVLCTRPTPNGLSETGIPLSPIDQASRAPNRTRAERVWTDVAQSLGVPVATVKTLIAQGALKLYDPVITEKSLRGFCCRYGSLVNYELLSGETKEWLHSSMDFVRASGDPASHCLARLRKHAHILRQCGQCGHAIRGNVFFSHIKTCGLGPSAATDGLLNGGTSGTTAHLRHSEPRRTWAMGLTRLGEGT